jgi:hypothetical protein
MLSLIAGLAFTNPQWEVTGSGMLQGISGIALVEAQRSNASFLVVRDSKKAGEPRVARLDIRHGQKSTTTELPTPTGEEPIDLEAISPIPGSLREFLMTTSAGKVWRVRLAADSASYSYVGAPFMLPNLPSGVNLEGMSLQRVGGETLLAWGERGKLPQKAVLHWCGWDGNAPSGAPQKVELNLPWPTAETARGISDIKIDPSGTVFVTAAADFGDDGPFQSGLFLAGSLRLSEFRPAAMTRMLWFEGKKIEGMEFVPGHPGGMVFGTDDESLGGSVWQNIWPQ